MRAISDETYTFEQGEQVRIKPSKYYPPTKAKGGIRYGFVILRTRHAGMCFIDLDRRSNEGEEAYAVGSWTSRGRSGGPWFSTAALEKMKRRKT